MAKKMRRAAVLGGGVMGTGIAAHLAGAGLEVTLLDIVPRALTDEERARGITRDDRAFRDRLATSSLARAVKAKPPVYHHPADAEAIVPGNFDDDMGRIAECDWIVEAVVENLDIKRQLLARVEEHRKPGTLVTSNTSGLSIEAMLEGRSDEFARHFFVTHFFNPVRFMRLLELVPGRRTDPDALSQMKRFGADVLGKGIVVGKDTPNFIANRIGTYAMLYLLHAMERDGFSIEEIDALFGKPMGRPKSAVFRTADVVGLDTLVHVADNCHASLVDDECRETFEVPRYLRELVSRGWLGQKSGQGFYKKQGKTIYALDYKTFEYHERDKVRADSIGAVRKIEDPGQRVAKLLQHDDRFAKLAWEVTARTLIYAANRVGEIADDVVNIDNAMRWGFAWDQGPFELWDAIGVRDSVERMKSDGLSVPANVARMLERGVDSFYGGSASTPTYYDFDAEHHVAVERDPRHIKLAALAETGGEIERNSSASLYDLGDGVLGVEFHSKLNAIDDQIIAMLHRAIDRAEQEGWSGVVIGNEDQQAFCAGANLLAILMAVGGKQWDALEQMIDRLQQATLRMRYSDIPVVSAPAGLALGGGAEVVMGADTVRAHAETYIGLVEVGVGLIPAGGGCLMLLERFCDGLPDDPAFDPMPQIQRAFQNIALAKVAVGAGDARRLGMLRHSDTVTFDRDLLLHDAKQLVLGSARAGYRRPRKVRLRLPGESGVATFRWFVDGMVQGGQASEHDAKIAAKLAWVLCGGHTSTRARVSQQHILDLEREAFLSLVGEGKTQARMQHMLQKGKPLRN